MAIFLLKLLLFYLSILGMGLPLVIIITSANTISESKEASFGVGAKVCLVLSFVIGLILFVIARNIG